MNNRFDLIALDMDGTLLDDRKEIGKNTAAVIHSALRKGKEVVICTGRALAETERFLEEFPDMHYLLCESGALLFDLREKKILYRAVIDRKDLEYIFAAADGRDIMPIAFSGGKYYANRSQIGRLADYQMGSYAEESPKVATPTEDLRDDILSGRMSVEKLNLFHTSPKERRKTDELLSSVKLEAEKVFSEISSLEFSPRGVSKGTGLQRLSELSGIPAEKMIMVGDADNDLTALEFAGLAVAMENANDHVRSVCDAVTADNNHDGCAKAIRTYLLDRK